MKKKPLWLFVSCVAVITLVTWSCDGMIPVDGDQEEEEEEVVLRPAEFTIESLEISPSEITEGESCTVTVNVTNIGGLEGNYEVALRINNEIVETNQVALEAGSTETISFSLTSSQSGNYTVDVNGLSDVLEVKALTLRVGGSGSFTSIQAEQLVISRSVISQYKTDMHSMVVVSQ